MQRTNEKLEQNITTGAFYYRQHPPRQRPLPRLDVHGEIEVESNSRKSKSNAGTPRNESERMSSLATSRGLLLTTHWKMPLRWAPSESTKCQKAAARQAGKQTMPFALSFSALLKAGMAIEGGGHIQQRPNTPQSKAKASVPAALSCASFENQRWALCSPLLANKSHWKGGPMDRGRDIVASPQPSNSSASASESSEPNRRLAAFARTSLASSRGCQTSESLIPCDR